MLSDRIFVTTMTGCSKIFTKSIGQKTDSVKEESTTIINRNK